MTDPVLRVIIEDEALTRSRCGRPWTVWAAAFPNCPRTYVPSARR